MPTNFYKVVPGNAPLASHIAQITDALSGANDVGPITLAPQIAPPSTASVTTSLSAGNGLGVGAYIYKFTYAVGYKQTDGSVLYGAETNGSASINVTTTIGNQIVKLSGLPTTWPSTAVALRIYRTTVGGADGTQKLVATITTPTSTYTDSIGDANLGASIPTVNGTGTTLVSSGGVSLEDMLAMQWMEVSM